MEQAIALLDEGAVRVAEPRDGDWVTNAWLKSAILLYFRRRRIEWMGDRRGDGARLLR